MDTTLAVSEISNSDFSIQLNQLFVDMPEELYNLLDEAHNRYLHLIGVAEGGFNEYQLQQDRERYGQFIQQDNSGRAIFSDDDCAAFMSASYCVPQLLCRMFVANVFNWTAASGFVDDDYAIESSNQELSKHLQNTDELNEALQFLYLRGQLIETQHATPQ